MKKKILIITNEFQNIINFRLPLIKYLKKNNFQVMAICKTNQIRNNNQYSDIETFNLEIDSKSVNIFNEIIYLFRLFKIIKNIKPTLIMSFTIKPNIYSSLISKILNIKHILTITGLGSSFISKGFVSKITFFMYKIFNNKNIFFVFQNKSDYKIFLKYKINKIHNSKIICGSGVDIKKYTFSPIKNNKVFSFLFLGRLIIHKGIKELYEATLKLKKLTNKDFNLIVAGSYNPYDKYSIDKILFEKIQNTKFINYVGKVDNSLDYITNSDCVLLPSYREGMSMSLLESGSVGRILLASNVPGCREIILNDFNGYLFKVRDSDDLCSKMLEVLNTPRNKLLKFSKNSHNHVALNFSSDIINKNYLNLINSLL